MRDTVTKTFGNKSKNISRNATPYIEILIIPVSSDRFVNYYKNIKMIQRTNNSDSKGELKLVFPTLGTFFDIRSMYLQIPFIESK